MIVEFDFRKLVDIQSVRVGGVLESFLDDMIFDVCMNVDSLRLQAKVCRVDGDELVKREIEG